MASTPRILFAYDDFAPDDLLGGGARKIFMFAHTLRELGFDAHVLQRNPTPNSLVAAQYGGGIDPIGGHTFAVRRDDLLVVPEALAVRWHGGIPEGLRWAMLTQGAYLSFHLADLVPTDAPSLYRDPRLCGVICVSEDSRAYLEYAFPWLDVWRVRLGLSRDLWNPGRPKERTVAFMPRRGANIARQVLQIASLNGHLDGWQLDPIDGVSEREAHDRLGAALVFMSIPNPGGEGFGLPIAEAMAAGCVVVGFGGRGGDELFRDEFSTLVPEGDVIGLARALATVLARPEEELRQMGRRASEVTLANYTPQFERDDLAAAFRDLLAKPVLADWDTNHIEPPAERPRWKKSYGLMVQAWRNLRGQRSS